MKNIEKWDKNNEWWFSWLLNQLKNSLKKNDEKKELPEEKKPSQKEQLLTLEQEIRNKYDQYEKIMKQKEEEKEKNLPYFKTALKKLKGNIHETQLSLDYVKPQLEIYTYAKKSFDDLESTYGREKVLNLIESIVVSWLQPRRNDEKWNADKWRVDSILDLYNWTPDIIAQLLF